MTHSLGKQKGPRQDPLQQAAVGKGSRTRVPGGPGLSGTLLTSQSQFVPRSPSPDSLPVYVGPPSSSRTVLEGCRSTQNWEESTAHQPTQPCFSWNHRWHQSLLTPAHPLPRWGARGELFCSLQPPSWPRSFCRGAAQQHSLSGDRQPLGSALLSDMGPRFDQVLRGWGPWKGKLGPRGRGWGRRARNPWPSL